MKTVLKKRILKSIALFFAFNILLDVVFPSVAWALTDGPKQPEYSSFEPVATTNMVSDFSGQFTYNLPVVNIPGPNGSGYAMSLAYHSGNNSEAEASWVGHGWSLNPGAINRNLQGVPDDYNGDVVTYYNKRRPSITATMGPKIGLEAFSMDASASFTYSYNNYRGLGSKLGIGLGIGYGLVNIGYSVSGQEPGSFSADMNIGAFLKGISDLASKKANAKNTKTKSDKLSKFLTKHKAKINKINNRTSSKAFSALAGLTKMGMNASNFNMSTSLTRYSNTCFSTSFGSTFGIDPSLLHIGVETGIEGTFSYMENETSWNTPKSGLLYSSSNDYSVEKESPYNVRDRYLPIPHKAKDQFVMTGEALSGGFSLVNPRVDASLVDGVSNSVFISSGGSDVNVGLNIGAGFHVGAGFSTSDISNFSSGYVGGFPSTNLSPFFRFNNDPGGNVVFTKNIFSNHKFYSVIDAPNNTLSTTDYRYMNVRDLHERPGASTFIGYNTINDRILNSKVFSATKDEETLSHVNLGGVIPGSRISDIYTVNDQGSTLIYGLPVFVYDEEQVSVDVLEKGNFNGGGVKDIFIKTDQSEKIKLGHANGSTYATSYLLTQISTPDYIDRTLNGPSVDDFGGWTSFGYRKPSYGNSYKFRSPYVGLSYSQGSLTDKDDDLGSYQSGKKEMYYLKQVETKTHIAFFITNKTQIDYNGLILQGSGNDRHDGVEAPANSYAISGSTVSANNRPEYLEKIVVYSKNDLLGKPVSTVNFEYDYQLAPGILNHKCTEHTTANGGKLTLKKVWFEYEGVIGAKIAPYEFKYEYKLPAEFKDFDLKTKYSQVVDYGNSLSASDQNPSYKTWAIDAWGNYRKDGTTKIANKENGVNQHSDPTFDPAAWQLKQIKLPTGGEILIQYEQQDYRYVQDQLAMTMVRLANVTNDLEYKLDVSSIEGLVTQADKTEYVKMLNNYLKNEKIYFKFLYSLINNTPANLNDCTNEFITGFANAKAVLNTSGDISIQINDNAGGGSYNTPKDICKWFVKRKIAGKTLDQNCEKNNVDLFFAAEEVISDPLVLVDMASSILSAAVSLAGNDILGKSCPQMSTTYSYFRVPVFKAKKGGGVRVKRILMYDQGIEAASSGSSDRDEVLYGTEYIYEDEKGRSTGVATNEPMSIREENSLVRSLVGRNDPTFKEKMLSGSDRETFEGPLGEQLLPSPSIGYSRIITQNIHTGKSGTGYKISDFYTCKDFPFRAKNSSVRAPGSTKYNIPAFVVNIDVEIRAAAQSYEFLINDMHGKQRAVHTYKGAYDPVTHQPEKFTFSEIHDYYKLDEKVDVMDRTGAISPDYIGKEETVTYENRVSTDEYNGMATQFDISVGFNFPPPVVLPQFSGMGYVNNSFKEFHVSVFNKTISLTAVPKSVTTTQDGITHKQINRVFNKYNGAPIVVDTYDGYNGLANLPADGTNTPHEGIIRTHTVPAHFVNIGMGQKVQNEQMIFMGKTFTSAGNKLTVGTSEMKYFMEGDLLSLTNTSATGMYYVESKSGNELNLVLLSRTPPPTVEVPNPVSVNNAVNTGNVIVKIINSGYTNQLNANAASVVTYGNSEAIGPLSEVYDGTTNKLKSPTNVIAASVTNYNSNWVSSVIRGESTDDDYSLGMKGKWRMQSQVVFNTTLIDGVTAPANRVYNGAGTYTLDSYTFNSQNNSSKWIVSSLVNLYSSDGNMLEDQNALGVKSSSAFSHNNTVPSYIAKNAPFGSCTYQSYEDYTTTSYSTEKAHTGKRSMKLEANEISSATSLTLDAATKQKETLVRFWLNASNAIMDDVNKNVQLSVSDIGNTASVKPKLSKIAQVGEWTLYEGVVRGLKNFTSNSFNVTLANVSTSSIFIDDFRIQPIESEMVCYAYDGNTLRLLATFDDQHFGMLYQYNGEGKLVRKIVETERGVKTISETQYNTPKKSR